MSPALRFLHASDLHLERPPRGMADVPNHLRAALGDAPYQAALRAFDAAIAHHVDFVLLAGDVVDPLAAGPRAIAFLADQFQRLSAEGINVYWAGGQADCFERWIDAWPLPPNVHRCASHRVGRVIHERAGQGVAQILGSSTPRRMTIRASEFSHHGQDLFSVALAYGRLGAHSLARHAIDYWALGGLHARRTIAGGPVTAHYCGTTQGRRPRESGPCGCTLVDVDEGRRVRLSFIPTDAVRYLTERVAVEPSTTVDELYRILSQRAGELSDDPFGPQLLIRWRIAGSPSLANQLRSSKAAADLVGRLRAEFAHKRPGVWTLDLAARAPQLAAELHEEQTLLGEFLRTLRHYAEHPDEPLSLEQYLAPGRHADVLARLAALEDAPLRARVLAEGAALGVELLRPHEARP